MTTYTRKDQMIEAHDDLLGTAHSPFAKPGEDRLHMPLMFPLGNVLRKFYKHYKKLTGHNYAVPSTDPTIIRIAWRYIDEDRAELSKISDNHPYADYVEWTVYRRGHRPMGFFPLPVLKPKGKAIYDRLSDKKTGLIGRSPNHRGISADGFFLTWQMTYVKKTRWDDKTRQFREVNPKTIHHSYSFEEADYLVVRDKLIDEGLCQLCEVEFNNTQAKFIFKIK